MGSKAEAPIAWRLPRASSEGSKASGGGSRHAKSKGQGEDKEKDRGKAQDAAEPPEKARRFSQD